MKQQLEHKPTMNDVARLAGVSQSTVSLVINGSPEIPEETKERVMAAVTELGYRPNISAQSLRTKKSGLIGFITDEIAITPFAGRIFEGAQDAAWEQGKILLMVNTKGDPMLQDKALEMLLNRQVEGIIYATMFHKPVNPPKILWDIPSILIDCFVEDQSLPSIVPDEISAACRATKILLEKGHQRVGFVQNIDSIPATAGRLQGYKQALAEYGIPFDPSLVIFDNSNADGGYRCTQRMLQLSPRPTALFCFNDRMAMGAYDALRKQGLSIPEDMAVVGFDNQEVISAHLYPPLSTMELPHYEMGCWATNYLMGYLNREHDLAPVQKLAECPLIERNSV